ncbi:IS607 family element RNA-guided endonuclease TnpB [soil metagenome]
MQVTQAYRFALDPTPAQQGKLASHCGGRRFAYNWGLGLVKSRLDARAAGESVPWTLPALRREWNASKAQVAPWWAQNSKEAYSAGLADLARGLDAFSKSKRGQRDGPPVGFPRFKARGRGRESYRYTTGRFGVSGRCRVQLPRVGHVRTHEPTAKLLTRIKDGRARVLSMTVCRENGRWFCSLCCEVKRCDQPATRPGAIVGVDVGIKHLAVLSTGETIPNPRAIEVAQKRLRRYQRRLDRQRRAGNPGCYDERGRAVKGRRPANRSQRMRRTEQRVTRLHARARAVRRDGLCKLTSSLAATYGTVVVEHLNVAGMVLNHKLARALSDAGFADIRRQLAYKTAWRGGRLVVAERFYPSSKTCSACGAAKAKLLLSERTYRCEHCGLVLDRDVNAARNLAALVNHVAPSGGETLNARYARLPAGVPRTLVRPGTRAGPWVGREARTT